MEHISSQMSLGRYRLLKIIGRGGMGEVWLAEDARLRRQVAIKTLPRQQSQDDPQYLLRFEREARAAASLHHPHILPIHDYGQQQLPNGETVTYIVMSYIASGTVRDRLDRLLRDNMLLSPTEALTYLTQAAEAIDFAHEHGIIHRDIKPANMLLREDNWLLLADFGLARIVADNDNLTKTDERGFGTPKYMAPEQAQGKAIPASDTYSLAVIAYEFATGKVPFNADTPYATIVQHIVSPPQPPRQVNPMLSPNFEAVLLRGLEKDPSKRFSTALAFVNALRQSMADVPLIASIDSSLSPSRSGPIPANTNNTPYSKQATISLIDPKPTKPGTISRRAALIGGGISILVAGGGITAYALNHLVHPGLPPQPTHKIINTQNANAPILTIQSAFTQPVIQLAWSPTSNTLLALGGDGHVATWDIQDNQSPITQPSAQLPFKLYTDISDFSGFTWSPDGASIALANAGLTQPDVYNETRVYKSDLATLAPGFAEDTIVYTNSHILEGQCWSSAGFIFTVATISHDANHLLLSTFNTKQPQQKITPLVIAIEARLSGSCPMAISPDGSLLAIGATTDGLANAIFVNTIHVSGTQVQWQPPQNPLETGDYDINALAWSPDGRYLATVMIKDENNHLVGVWDASQNYQPLHPIQNLSNEHIASVSIAWSGDLKNLQFAYGGGNGKVYLWQVSGEDANHIRTIVPGMTNKITSLSWSHDGKWLAASYDDGAASILLWKMESTHA